jgi:hypothetical protein
VKLRADIEVGDGWLHDRLFDRRLELGAAEMDALRRLPEIADERIARMFLHLNLIEGAGEEAVSRARQLRRGVPVGRVILNEARFQCAGSGDCCQSYNYGPLTDEDMARLTALLPEGGWWYERNGKRYLKSVEQRCVFLQDDCRCGLHVRFGPEAKPDLCRFYPYQQMATLWGVQYYDKGHCSELARTARSGPPLGERLDELIGLLGPPGLYHPVVLLPPRLPVDYGYVRPLFEAAVDELERPSAGALEMLRAAGRRARALGAALAKCALTPEAPSAAVSSVLGRGLDLAAPAGDALQSGAAALARMARLLTKVALKPLSRDESYMGRQTRELVPVLQLLDELGAHLAEGRKLSAHAREVAAVSIDDADSHDVLRLSLRNQLFGHDALVEGSVAAAQLRMAMVQLVALWGGRLRAAADGRARICADDLSRSHMLAMRVTSWKASRRMFAGEDAQAELLLEGLPALARWMSASG